MSDKQRKAEKAPVTKLHVDDSLAGEIGDVVHLDENGNPKPRLVYSSIPGVPPRIVPPGAYHKPRRSEQATEPPGKSDEPGQ